MHPPRTLLAVFAVVSLALAVKLRGPAPASAPGPAPGPAPAPGPMGAPGASPAAPLTPVEAVEEAHHAHALATTDRILDASKQKLKEADVAKAKAGIHVAVAQGDKDLKKEYKDKLAKHSADLTKLKKEAAASKATHKASEQSYSNAEKVVHEYKAEKAGKDSKKKGGDDKKKTEEKKSADPLNLPDMDSKAAAGR